MPPAGRYRFEQAAATTEESGPSEELSKPQKRMQEQAEMLRQRRKPAPPAPRAPVPCVTEPWAHRPALAVKQELGNFRLWRRLQRLATQLTLLTSPLLCQAHFPASESDAARAATAWLHAHSWSECRMPRWTHPAPEGSQEGAALTRLCGV